MSDTLQNTDPQTGSNQQPPSSPAGDAVDWQARYNGLNRRYQESQAEWQAKHSDAVAQATAATKQITELTGRLETLQNQFTERTNAFEKLNTDFATANSRAATLEGTVERQKLFLGEYRDLADFESQGLLRTDLHGDDLRAHLDTYRNTLSNIQNSVAQRRMEGFVPAPTNASPAGTGIDKDVLWEQLNEAAAKRDWATHSKLNAQWIELNR